MSAPKVYSERVSTSVYRKRDGSYSVYETRRVVPAVCRRNVTEADVKEFVALVAGGDAPAAAAKQLAVALPSITKATALYAARVIASAENEDA